MAPKRTGVCWHLSGVFLLYLVASLLTTSPTGFKMGSELPVGGDSWQNNWNLWWTGHALEDPDLSLLRCPLIFYPEGLSLTLHSNSYLNTFLTLPLQSFVSIERIHYFLIWIYFPLSAMGAYLLARRWMNSPLAAFMAGWIYAFAPYRIGRYVIEQIDILSTAFIPLFILFALKFLDRYQWRAAAFGGICLLLQLLSSWYNGAYCLLFLGFILIYRWFADQLPVKDRRLWLGLGILVALPGLLLLPLILPMLHDLSLPLFSAHVDQTEVSKATSSDLLAFFLPSVMYPSFLDQAFHWHGPLPHKVMEDLSRRILEGRGSNVLEATCYLGWVNMILYGLFCWRIWRKGDGLDESTRQWGRFWAMAVLVFGILAMGPILQVAGWKTGIPLPGLFINVLPGFSILRAPVRLTILIMLALGICVGLMLDRWVTMGKKRWALVVAILITVDLAMVPVHRLYEGRPIPPVYQSLAEDPTPGAVWEVPSGFHFPASWYNVRAMYYQTCHQRPLLIGYISRTPEDPFGLREKYPMIRALSHENLMQGGSIEGVDTERGRKDLLSLGVRYIVIHPQDVLEVPGSSEEALENILQLAISLAGAPIQQDQETVTWRIDPE